MGEGWRKHGMMRHGGMMGPLAMRIIFALMDPDGDGTISLEEFQAAHERIFKRWTPTKMAPLVRRRCWISCGDRLSLLRSIGRSGTVPTRGGG
jgi:EF hand